MTTYNDAVGQTVLDVSLGKRGNNFKNLNKKLSPVTSTSLVNIKSLTLPAFHTRELYNLFNFMDSSQIMHFTYFLLI